MVQLLWSKDPKGLNIFDLPELLEQILYFLEIDRFLYPALFVNHLWYHCGAPILWRRVEFFNEDYQQSRRALNMSRVLTRRLINFERVMREKIKPLYCSKMEYLRLEGCKGINKEVIKKFNPKIKIEYPDYSDEKWSNSDLPLLFQCLPVHY